MYNILVICNKSPWPPKEGGPIAMNNLIEGLIKAGNKVKVLAINTNKYAVKPKEIPIAYQKKTGLELGFIDLSIKPVPAFFNLFSKNSYHVQRFISSDFEKLLIKTLQKSRFDIVQIETLFMSPYLETIRNHSNAKVVYRAHNIEYLIWKRLWQTASNFLKKAYLQHLFKTLKNYELTILSQYDGILPISVKDAEFFKRHTQVPVRAIPFGIEINKLKPYLTEPAEHALFHIGAMNWMPNEEGIRWFLQNVWPIVHKAIPSAKLYLAGREMPAWLKNLRQEKVTVVGEVENAYTFIGKYTLSIAPLLSGSGIRIKIIESMALGKAVVSTGIGAEGIQCENGETICIADTPEAFADGLIKLYSNPEYCRLMGKKAAALIAKQHDSDKIIAGLMAFYAEIL